MFAVEVREAIMIAHSLPDPFFGPAQNKHGATFVVDVAFFADNLSAQNVVVDIYYSFCSYKGVSILHNRTRITSIPLL